MTNPFTPYLSFVLGPPADPQYRAHFDETQRAFRLGGDDRTLEETCILLEPRIPWFVAEREGAPSFLSEAVSLALDSPVEVVEPALSWGYFKGEYVAQLQIDPRHVRGPEDALDGPPSTRTCCGNRASRRTRPPPQRREPGGSQRASIATTGP